MIKISICFIVGEARPAGTRSHSATERERERDKKTDSQKKRERRERNKSNKEARERERAISREEKGGAIKNTNRQSNNN